jgi:hypothetical protein
MQRRAALVAITVLLTACSVVPVPPVPPPDVPEVPRPMTDVESIEELRAYGLQHPDTFGGMYIDPPGGDDVVMLFTAEIERHTEAVEAIRAGTRVRQVEHTMADLEALIESLDLAGMMSDDVQPMSAGIDERENRVHLEVKTNDPTLELSLELAHDGMLEVTVFPIPGPWENVETGDGWRLLASGEGSAMEAYVVRAATDADAWDELWSAMALGGGRPSADLEEEVVVSFAHGVGSSCTEVRLDAVVIGDGVVFSQTSDPLAPRDCTADLAGAAVFVVAIARDALPPDGFTLRLCAACEFAEPVDVSLP